MSSKPRKRLLTTRTSTSATDSLTKISKAAKKKPVVSERFIQESVVAAVVAAGYGCIRVNSVNARTIGGYVHSYITYPGHYIRGLADLIVVGGGGVVFVECKTDVGKLSEEQQKFRTWAEARGCVYLVARDASIVEDIVNVLTIGDVASPTHP